VGQEWLGPSHFFIPLVLGPLNSLVWYVPSLGTHAGYAGVCTAVQRLLNQVPINNIISQTTEVFLDKDMST
jgi:hypothetical protein